MDRARQYGRVFITRAGEGGFRLRISNGALVVESRDATLVTVALSTHAISLTTLDQAKKLPLGSAG